jgi:hypothetical protein
MLMQLALSAFSYDAPCQDSAMGRGQRCSLPQLRTGLFRVGERICRPGLESVVG